MILPFPPPSRVSLRADQVVGLDAVGALVDFGDLGIAHELGGAGFLDIAHATMNLDTHRRRFGTQFPYFQPLTTGSQQIDDGLDRLAGRGIGMAIGHVEPGGGEIGESAAGLGQGPPSSAASDGYSGWWMMVTGFALLPRDVSALHALAGE